MLKGVWWWDLTKINKLVANYAKIPQFILSEYPSIEWFLFKIRSWHWFVFDQSQDLCQSRMYLNHESFVAYRCLVQIVIFIGQSQDHFLSNDIDYKTFLVNGSRLTGIIRFVFGQSPGLVDSEDMVRRMYWIHWHYTYVSDLDVHLTGSRNWMRSNWSWRSTYVK